MAVSKHNLWKRQKNGLMKLVRSHSDWLERRREMKTRKRNATIRDTQWWEKDNTTHDQSHKKGIMMSDGSSSPTTKRTQVGKKI